MPPAPPDPLGHGPQWMVGSAAPPLEPRAAHVWRIPLGGAATRAAAHVATLSTAERDRMARFVTQDLRDRFALAHGGLRRVLAFYTQSGPGDLVFYESARGKPSLANSDIQFNLSHSGDIALVAVALRRQVGVDVEQWKEEVEHHSVAEYCFSPLEQQTLRESPDVAAAFFAAWSRKEAYIKASGAGVMDGLDHFDVSMSAEAALIQDRRDETARRRWIMRNLDVGSGYSAALVVEAPLDDVVLRELSDP